MRQERKAEIKAAIIKELKSLIGPLIILAIIAAAVAVILLWPDKVVEEEIIQMKRSSFESFLDLTCEYPICPCLTQYDHLYVQPCCCEWHYFIIFYG